MIARRFARRLKKNQLCNLKIMKISALLKLGLSHQPMSLAERAKATVAALVEFIPPARFDHGAVFQHINEVGPANRREPMRDDDYRQTAAQRLNRAEHARLVVVIEAVGGLVENQQSGAAQECTRQG